MPFKILISYLKMSWHTKDDVLGDLAEVMGNEIKEFDQQYILHGEQPPPPACTSNEMDNDELYLRLHGELGDRTINEDYKSPDLSGITEMLRMVDKFQRSSDVENVNCSSQSSGNTSISITKLSVNVPEFVPKNDINKENTSTERLCSEHTMDQAKIKELSDQLKSRISNPYKTNNLKMKRERNLAIASLLKLHSIENSIPDETTPKLITPEHFQKTSGELLNEEYLQKSPKKLMPFIPLQVKNVESPIEIAEEVNSKDQELKESVAKVNSWLNKGSDKKMETRVPALYLGPVTFKRKEVKKPRTPNSEISDKSTKRVGDNTFVPSEHADKLAQSYMDRVKAKEDKSLDIWGKLERDLKVKDTEIIKKHQNLSFKQSSQQSSNASQS